MGLELAKLTKHFGEKAVLDTFTLSVTGPQVLMGPSGCGKTTLLRIVMGLETPDTGTVTGVGRLAAVFQEDRLCPQLTAADNICLTGRGVTSAEAKRELCALGFTETDLAQPVSKLSGGQKRRVALLRALLCKGVETLLLDEPFTGMDAELVATAAAATVRLVGDRDCILVTHDQSAAALLGWPVRGL